MVCIRVYLVQFLYTICSCLIQICILVYRGKTHKRDVVKFAKDQALAAFNNQSRSFEEREASYILWQVLALMVQQNGVSRTAFLQVYRVVCLGLYLYFLKC
jgi:hypothetical protein